MRERERERERGEREKRDEGREKEKEKERERERERERGGAVTARMAEAWKLKLMSGRDLSAKPAGRTCDYIAS